MLQGECSRNPPRVDAKRGNRFLRADLTDLLLPNFTISPVVPANYSKISVLNVLKVLTRVPR